MQADDPPRRLGFGVFGVDLRDRQLTKRGLRIRLQEQPFQVLAMLLERPGEVVTRDELRNRLWPNTVVEFDHGLNKAISKIREVLGDSVESPRFVETVARRGYRFLADVAVIDIPDRQSEPTPDALASSVNEFVELADWFGWRAPHEPVVVDSLPTPTFTVKDRPQVSFSTNNYLGIATSPRTKAAATRGIKAYGVGNSDSRLLGGNLALYGELERKIARSNGKSHAILFATGYLTNLGALSTLPRATQIARVFGFTASREYSYAYFSDEYNHISIREGMRLSGARRYSYHHVDLDHLETLLRRSTATSKIIVTDGVFSQDGDIAPIPDLLRLAERWDALVYVDDAHGTGVLGASGGGVVEHFKAASERLIYMGTLSKAYGSIGGYIAAHELITEVLRMACPAYGFTATLPPDQAMVISTAIDVVRDEPERRQRLWDNQRYFVKRMAELNYKLVATETPIVPIWLGDEAKAEQLALAVREEGIHVDAIRFPAVPVKSARLRIQLNAGHRRADIDHLVDVLRRHQHLAEPARRFVAASRDRRATVPQASPFP